MPNLWLFDLNQLAKSAKGRSRKMSGPVLDLHALQTVIRSGQFGTVGVWPATRRCRNSLEDYQWSYQDILQIFRCLQADDYKNSEWCDIDGGLTELLETRMLTVTQLSQAPQIRFCPACRKGPLHEAQRERVFHPHGQRLVIPLLTSVCEHCGAEATSSAQHDENLRRLAARKEHYGGLLMLEEILALRRRYGLTQQLASRIFGKGKIAFSRYESETTYPDASTTLLISLAIARPEVLKWLADRAGVEIPLWQARCEDAQRAAALNAQDVKPPASDSPAAAVVTPAAPATRSTRMRNKAKEKALP